MLWNRCIVAGGFVLVASALLFGCVTPRPPAPPPKPPMHTLRYERASWPQLPGWGADGLQEAWTAFLSSCRALRFRVEWKPPCDAALAITDESLGALRHYFEQYFEPYQILKVPSPIREDTGLITGYYEPLLMGARTPSAEFATPLYAPPPDLLIVDLASLYPELKGKTVRGRLKATGCCRTTRGPNFPPTRAFRARRSCG